MRLAEPRIAPLSDAEFTPEQKEVLAPLGRRVFNIFRTLAREPKALKAFLAWANYVLSRRNGLSPRQREIIILRIGFLCRCEYEWAHHRSIARAAGISDAEIERIKSGATAGWNDLEATLILASDELHMAQFITGPTWAQLTKHLSEKQCMDVVFTAGQYTQVCMMLKTFGVQLESDQAPDQDLDVF